MFVCIVYYGILLYSIVYYCILLYIIIIQIARFLGKYGLRLLNYISYDVLLRYLIYQNTLQVFMYLFKYYYNTYIYIVLKSLAN